MTGETAVLLQVDDDVFGIGVDRVREVVVAPRVTVVPTTPPGVVGVFNLRGAVLPVLDTGCLLARTALTDAAYAVVVRCWDNDAALMVPSIPTMSRIGPAVQPSETAGTVGTYRVGDRLVTMVDPEALLSHAGLGIDRQRRTAG